MSLWTTTPDGTLINYDGVIKFEVRANTLKTYHADGKTTIQTFQDAATAAAAYKSIVDAVAALTTSLALRYITPNTGASGGTVNAVIVGSGFNFDIVTASFIGTALIGGTSATLTYINSNILLASWVPASPGAKDIVYTAKDGTTTVTLAAAFTAS